MRTQLTLDTIHQLLLAINWCVIPLQNEKMVTVVRDLGCAEQYFELAQQLPQMVNIDLLHSYLYVVLKYFSIP